VIRKKHVLEQLYAAHSKLHHFTWFMHYTYLTFFNLPRPATAATANATATTATTTATA